MKSYNEKQYSHYNTGNPSCQLTKQNFYQISPKKRLNSTSQNKQNTKHKTNYENDLHSILNSFFHKKTKKTKNSQSSQQIKKQKSSKNNNKNIKSIDDKINFRKLNNNINYKKYNIDQKKLFSYSKKINPKQGNKNLNEIKEKYMKELIDKGVESELRKYRQQKLKLNEEVKNNKKLNVLEHNGIIPNYINESLNSNINDTKNNDKENDLEDNETNYFSNKNNYNNFYYNTCTNFNTALKSSKLVTPKLNNCQTLYNDDLLSAKKQKLKPKINQFEYLQKIKKIRDKNEHKQKIGLSMITKKRSFLLDDDEFENLDNINLNNNKDYNECKNNPTLNESFRHKNKTKNINNNFYGCNNHYKDNNKYTIKEKTESNREKRVQNLNKFNFNEDEFPYANKKSYRSPEEIHKYIKNKKYKEKKIEEKKQNLQKEKLFSKYKNLCYLNNNSNIAYNTNNNFNTTSNYFKKYETIFKSKTQTTSKFISKKKEANQFYLGNESFKNNSTVLDANDYYTNILESQQLIDKNEFNKTQSYFHRNNNNYINDNKNNFIKINVYNENHDKNNKSINNMDNNSNHDININDNNYKKQLIKKKLIETLANAKKIFSDDTNTTLIDSYDTRILAHKKINKLTNVFKKIFHRVVFYRILEYYRYIIFHDIYYYSFQFFIGICKKYALQKLIDNHNNKINLKLLNIIKPFLRKNFMVFVNNCYFKTKLIYFVDFITKFFKHKFFEKLYFSIQEESDNIQQAFIFVLTKIIKTLKKPHLIPVFDLLKNLSKKNLTDDEENNRYNNHLKNNSKNFDEHPSVEKKNANELDNLNKNNFDIINNLISYEKSDDKNEFDENSDLEIYLNNNKLNNDNSKGVTGYSTLKNSDDNNAKIEKELTVDKNYIKDAKLKNIISSIENKNKNINEDRNEKINENIIENKNEKKFVIKDPEKLSDVLTEEILNKILNMEVKTIRLIPRKKFKKELVLPSLKKNKSSSNLNNSSENLGMNMLDYSTLSQLSLNESSFEDTIMYSYTLYSIFNESIKDKKKNSALYFYIKIIAPILIKLLKKEIKTKYDRIYKNISSCFINKSEYIMMSLALQDADMLRDNFKFFNNDMENISDIINKNNILEKFEPINKKIREKMGMLMYYPHDQILNNCIIDSCIELIRKERKYGENGNPLLWSSRMHELVFKYDKNDPKKLCDLVEEKLKKLIQKRVGLICENYEYMSPDQINMEREKRLMDNIKSELEESDYLWRNLEMEETQIKMETSDVIMEYLFNEIIEILEHVQFNRKRPDLYNYKSIYACEQMPKLNFQIMMINNNENKEENNEKNSEVNCERKN